MTMKFDTIVFMGEEFKINMFEEVSHSPIGKPQHLSPISRRSLRDKNSRDEIEMTKP